VQKVSTAFSFHLNVRYLLRDLESSLRVNM
jgi:hypothetical protein